jgi:hypothetical protein
MSLKPGMHMLVLGATADSATALLAPMPDPISIEPAADGRYDFVISFVVDQASANAIIPLALAAARRDTVLWFCYPKGTSKVKTDINRDRGWTLLHEAGWGPVGQVAVDDTWSASRFRPEADVRRKAGSVVAPPHRD